MTNKGKFKPNRELIEGESHIENTSNRYITITEDKLRICAKDLKSGIKSKASWGIPLSLVITLTITLLTVTFQDKYGKEAIFWEALFIFSIIFTIVWFLYSIFQLVINYKKASIDSFIKSVRGESNRTP